MREWWLAAVWRASEAVEAPSTASGAVVDAVATVLRDPRLVVFDAYAVRSVYAGSVTLFLGGSLRSSVTATPFPPIDDDFDGYVVALDATESRALCGRSENDWYHFDNDFSLQLYDISDSCTWRFIGCFNGFGLMALNHRAKAVCAPDGVWYVAVPRFTRFDGPPASVVVLSPELEFLTAFPVCCGKHPADICASATHVLVNMRSALALFERRAAAPACARAMEVKAGKNERFRCACLVDRAETQIGVIVDTGVQRCNGWTNGEWSGDSWDVHASETRIYDASGTVVRIVRADDLAHAFAIACSEYHELVLVEESAGLSRVFVLDSHGALVKTYQCIMELSSVRLRDGAIVCLGRLHSEYSPCDSRRVVFG